MAPRPSSPTISYLPAFVTVGIIQSICHRAKTAPAAQSPIERIAFRLWKAGNLTSPRPSVFNFLLLISGNASADTRDALSTTLPTGFSFGQRYWGTSVSHSIRSECSRARLRQEVHALPERGAIIENAGLHDSLGLSDN